MSVSAQSLSPIPTTPTPEAIDSPAVVREVANGQGLSFSAAARLVPPARNGKATAPATLWRWSREGVRAGAEKVRLEVCRIGCRWVTSRPALERFLTALSSASACGADAKVPTASDNRREKTRRERQVAEAQSELQRLGI